MGKRKSKRKRGKKGKKTSTARWLGEVRKVARRRHCNVSGGKRVAHISCKK